MPSSTFSSKSGEPRRAIARLLVVIAIFSAALEIATSVGLRRISRIERRIDGEYRAARVIRQVGASGRPTVLLVGNSLLDAAVDMPRFDTQVGAVYDGSRFMIEQTAFLDWYFGLRRLFLEGARPAAVVMCMSTRHLLSPATRADYFANQQMAQQDFPEVVREEHLEATAASNYLFAHWSAWWGHRIEIRKWLFGQLMPDFAGLASFLAPKAGPMPADDVIRLLAAHRLAAIRQVCEAYGARIILLIPPVNSRTEGCCETTLAAGKEAGVTVLVPYAPMEMPSNLYTDGFHLAPEGATLFTDRLTRDLLAVSFR